MTATQGAADPPGADPDVLVYDGSFPGFLCALAEALNLARTKAPVPPIRARGREAGLFTESVEARRDDARAASLWRRLSRKLGEERLRTCLEAFCSDFEGKETALAAVIARAAAAGPAVFDDLNDPATMLVAKAARRAGAQAQLISGLVRFAELADGSWYAPIEPDCDVLPLVAEHFAARYADMAFAIHDRRRGTALVHEPGAACALVEGFEFAGGGGRGRLRPPRTRAARRLARLLRLGIDRATREPETAGFPYAEKVLALPAGDDSRPGGSRAGGRSCVGSRFRRAHGGQRLQGVVKWRHKIIPGERRLSVPRD